MTRRPRVPFLAMVAWLALLVGVSVLAFSAALQAHADDTLYVRLTFYTLTGRTASGASTGAGVAACSKTLPFGTLLEFEADGRVVECLDRGLGDYYWNPRTTGHDAWVDVWVPSYGVGIAQIERSYGTSYTVRVIRWGYDASQSTD